MFPEVKPRPTPDPLAEATDRADALRRMRDRLAIAIDDPNVPYRDLAALTRRYAEVLSELEKVPAPSGEGEGSPIEQVEARRRRRGADAACTDRS